MYLTIYCLSLAVDVSIANEGEGESDGVIVSQKVAQHRMEGEMKKEQQLCEQLKLSTAKQVHHIGDIAVMLESLIVHSRHCVSILPRV